MPNETLATVIALVERVREAAAALGTPQFDSLLAADGRQQTRLAPELTGRTSHAADRRADFYALGALAFEWATGRPPFLQTDPLRQLHEQLAEAPPSPLELRPGLPPALAAIVLRLLEKEPARRYQSAAGILHDVDRLLQALRHHGPLEFVLAERDFPARLVPPRHLGRERELAQMQAAVEGASRGEFRCLLLCGPPGAGKSALLEELRPFVAAHNGRFAAGKFEQYGRLESAGTVQALRSLGRLLLAEPETELATQRARILHALGDHAAVATAIPEFRLLLGELPQGRTPDPAHVIARTSTAMLKMLKAVACAERPLVLVLDDLQWSRESTLSFMEAMLDDHEIRGLVLVGVYRDDELQAGPALGAAIARWRQRTGAPQWLRVANFDDGQLAQCLGELLRLAAPPALALAQEVAAHTGGNPYDTIELINALRDDGVLRLAHDGWRWDPGSVRSYVGGANVVDLLAVRTARLPSPARELAEMLACMQFETSVDVASTACGIEGSRLQALLDVLSQAGLVERTEGVPGRIRTRHDRVQQAIYGRLDVQARAQLHLGLARRLAAGDMAAAAAAQYQSAAAAVSDPAEARMAAALLKDAAATARRNANFNASQRLLDAAVTLTERILGESAVDIELRGACEVDLHLSLCAIGQLDDADRVFERIARRQPDPLSIASAACAQVDSLTWRGRLREAIELGLSLSRRLGIEVPERFDNAGPAQFERLRAWVDGFDMGRELAREDASDLRVIAAARLLARIGLPACYTAADVACWVAMQGCALWERHGPSPHLAVVLCRIVLLASVGTDLRTGYRAGRTMVDFCEARRWEPEGSHCRSSFTITSLHWIEPLEAALNEMSRARRELQAAGDLQNACYTYRTSLDAGFECGATLQEFRDCLRAADEFAARTGHAQVAALVAADRDLLDELCGPVEGDAHAHCMTEREPVFAARYGKVPRGAFEYGMRRLMAAAISGDESLLCVLLERVEPLLPLSPGLDFTPHYHLARLRWLGAVGRCAAMRTEGRAPRLDRRPGLDALVDWLSERGAETPANFRHMALHAAAERAWALEDSPAAAAWFDAALREVEGVSRPWHRAWITERAARFQCARGTPLVARALLREAEALYRAWGALAKAERLREELGEAPPKGIRRGGGTSLPAADLDSLALLRAAQALASERTTVTLRVRVEEVLRSIAGATRVVLAVWDDDTAEWLVDDSQGGHVPAATAADRVPLTALRYTERTHEALVLPDAMADDRFARDACFAGAARCSLMVMPLLRKGAVRAVLVLENRESRGAFGTAILGAVEVIAGQLAVSLENAQLYDRLERKVSEQTQQLREAQSRLLAEARRAGMAQIATNVLHNVGNVLTSVNVSAHFLADRVRNSRASRVGDVARLLRGAGGDPGQFLLHDEKGRRLPAYVEELAVALNAERDESLAELDRLAASVDHIKNVVAMQQNFAGASGVLEQASITALVDEALRLHEEALRDCRIVTSRDYARVAPRALDRTRLMQILLNLVENARHAMSRHEGERILHVRVREDADRLEVRLTDTGCGIPPEYLPRIFSHGFTTRSDGHGFGLHSCAIAAHEMGGSLSVHSDGAGQGATFTLRLPVAAAP